MEDKEILDRWEQGKDYLRKWIANTPQTLYPRYESLLSAIVRECLNRAKSKDEYPYKKFRHTVRTVITGDEYEGEKVFILSKENSFSKDDVYFTYMFYDNEGADDLQCIRRIHDVNDKPTEKQVDLYMKLCFIMVKRMRNMKKLYTYEEINEYNKMLTAFN